MEMKSPVGDVGTLKKGSSAPPNMIQEELKKEKEETEAAAGGGSNNSTIRSPFQFVTQKMKGRMGSPPPSKQYQKLLSPKSSKISVLEFEDEIDFQNQLEVNTEKTWSDLGSDVADLSPTEIHNKNRFLPFVSSSRNKKKEGEAAVGSMHPPLPISSSFIINKQNSNEPEIVFIRLLKSGIPPQYFCPFLDTESNTFSGEVWIKIYTKNQHHQYNNPGSIIIDEGSYLFYPDVKAEFGSFDFVLERTNHFKVNISWKQVKQIDFINSLDSWIIIAIIIGYLGCASICGALLDFYFLSFLFVLSLAFSYFHYYFVILRAPRKYKLTRVKILKN